jgi:hypothetical protein
VTGPHDTAQEKKSKGPAAAGGISENVADHYRSDILMISAICDAVTKIFRLGENPVDPERRPDYKSACLQRTAQVEPAAGTEEKRKKTVDGEQEVD